MLTIERATAVGVFSEPALAEQAMAQLRNAGFTDEQIGFISRDPHIAPSDSVEDASNAPSTATGAVSGGVIGGVIGAVTSLLIPGFGPAIAGGILAATLGGVALGALAGGFVGSLTHLGVPEYEARFYEGQLNEGRTVVTVNAPGRYDDAVRILHQAGAYDANVSANAPAIDNNRAGSTYTNSTADTVPPAVYPAGLAGVNGPAGTVNPGLPVAAAFPAATPASTDPLAGNNATANNETVGSSYGSAEMFSTKKSPEELKEQERRLENEQGGASSVEDEDTVYMSAPGRNPGAAAAYGTDTTTPEYNGAVPAPAPVRSAYAGTDTTTPGTAGANDSSYHRADEQASDTDESHS
ncbi:hypothetical protein [Dictyobacter formicarum]|uniref:General stress protein 17M-like domain-containing protein n=1 Tax=Dictyobacter formicarum TaxID=2778368 RepID=A0ABQ3VQT0_9CHLR|nr:hypothetical protein [Dictyobacter formicarum]GHO87953.1 hypothetical protein KSZ_59590 [Dictyobacter formicarum]